MLELVCEVLHCIHDGVLNYILGGGDPRTLGWLPKRPGSPLWRGGCRSSCWAELPWLGENKNLRTVTPMH